MQEFLWTEKYRPHTVEDCIFPDRLTTMFKEFVNQKNMPNLLLAGGPGCGKTTIARAMLDEIGCDNIFINGSLEGNIDTLRVQIADFAASRALNGMRKYVIIDEADYLTHLTQPALRSFMEEFSANCGFILTCNFPNRIIDPLLSRLSVIDFTFSKQEKMDMAKKQFLAIKNMLNAESVAFEPMVIAELIKRYFPDFRKIINELQRYATNGKIDTGILAGIDDNSFKTLVGYLSSKDFTNAKKWVIESEVDDTTLFRKLYDAASENMDPGSIPQLILIIRDGMKNASMVADREINLIASLIEIMADCKFKD